MIPICFFCVGQNFAEMTTIPQKNSKLRHKKNELMNSYFVLVSRTPHGEPKKLLDGHFHTNPNLLEFDQLMNQNGRVKLSNVGKLCRIITDLVRYKLSNNNSICPFFFIPFQIWKENLPLNACVSWKLICQFMIREI